MNGFHTSVTAQTQSLKYFVLQYVEPHYTPKKISYLKGNCWQVYILLKQTKTAGMKRYVVKLTCARSFYMPCAVGVNGSLSAFYGCIVYHKPIKGQLNHLLLTHYKTLCLKYHCGAYSKSTSERNMTFGCEMRMYYQQVLQSWFIWDDAQ